MKEGPKIKFYLTVLAAFFLSKNTFSSFSLSYVINLVITFCQESSLLFFFTFFGSVILLQNTLQKLLPEKVVSNLTAPFYFFTVSFPLFILLLIAPYILFFGYLKGTEVNMVLLACVSLGESIFLVVFHNKFKKKYKEKIDKFMGLFLLGRISFASVITIFSKFFLKEEIVKEKISLINKDLTEKISNFDEAFYLAIDSEKLPIVEVSDYLISNIYILSLRVNETTDYDLAFLLFYVFILCPIFSFFWGFIFFSFENFSNLSIIVEEIRKEISSYLICNMLPASKAVSKTELLVNPKILFKNKPYHIIKKEVSETALIEAINKTKVKIIATADDLVLNNFLHAAANLSQNENEFVEKTLEVVEKIGKENKIIRTHKGRTYISSSLPKMNSAFYFSNQELKIANINAISREEVIYEKEQVKKFSLELGFRLQREVNSLKGSILVRDQNLELFGIKGYLRDAELIKKINAITNILFIDEIEPKKLFKDLALSYYDADQNKGYQIETRKKVLPQFIAARYFSIENNWILERNYSKGQGDYYVSDPITGDKYLLEIKTLATKGDFLDFKCKIIEYIETLKEKMEDQNITQRVILGVVFPYKIEGYCSEELTCRAQNLIEKQNYQEKIEIKIINLK